MTRIVEVVDGRSMCFETWRYMIVGVVVVVKKWFVMRRICDGGGCCGFSSSKRRVSVSF